jgi:hypothetical protein
LRSIDGNGEAGTDMVRQGAQVVVVQLGCDAGDALEALCDVATAADERLEAVAREVLAGTVRFDP